MESVQNGQSLWKASWAFFVITAVLVVGGIGLFVFFRLGGASPDQTDSLSSAGNVSVEEGRQVVVIRAKGGYMPSVSVAKAGIPTVLRVVTEGTFDCSSSVRIPSLQVSQILPATGETEIALGNLTPGILQGMCGMGMYTFQINVIE